MQPNLLIRDLDLIKQITIKDFDHFTNRNALISAENEPLFGKNIVSLKGMRRFIAAVSQRPCWYKTNLLSDQKWREMRNTLSPVFTASKIKIMFQLVNNCGKQMVQYIDNLIGKQIDRKHPGTERMFLDYCLCALSKKYHFVYFNQMEKYMRRNSRAFSPSTPMMS